MHKHIFLNCPNERLGSCCFSEWSLILLVNGRGDILSVSSELLHFLVCVVVFLNRVPLKGTEGLSKVCFISMHLFLFASNCLFASHLTLPKSNCFLPKPQESQKCCPASGSVLYPPFPASWTFTVLAHFTSASLEWDVACEYLPPQCPTSCKHPGVPAGAGIWSLKPFIPFGCQPWDFLDGEQFLWVIGLCQMTHWVLIGKLSTVCF